MSEIDNIRLHHTYDRVLYRWRDKINSLEAFYSHPKINLTQQSRAQLHSKIETLKSYFYSARYYSASEEEETRTIMKNLFREMKMLEGEISIILEVPKPVSQTI